MREPMDPSRGRRLPPPVPFVLGFAAATALWAVLALVFLHSRHYRPHDGPVRAARTTPGRDPLAALVARRLTQLGVRPKTVTLPSDESLAALLAIKRGDYATARRIADSVLAHSRLSEWRFHPFDRFMHTLIGAGNDPVLLRHLNAWIEHDPQSAIAYLIRAQYFRVTGWAERGTDFASAVPRAQMQRFGEDLKRSREDAQTSIHLDPRDPWSYLLLLKVVAGSGNSPQTQLAFRRAIQAFPGYYEPYRMRLYSLTPKWGGSVAAMYAFVDRYAEDSPPDSPLKLLYLQLYDYLVNAAWINCESLEGAAQRHCLVQQMNRIVSPHLGKHMLQALALYKVSDPIAFDNALWPILRSAASTPDSNGWAGLGALLQLAGRAMHSNSELTDHSAHNNYVLDDVNARIWEQIDNTDNVVTMYEDALHDIEHTKFPDEAQKDQAMAKVYDHMADFANDKRRHVDIIVYQRAADAVGGINHGGIPYLSCYAYEILRHFHEAVRSCTRLIQGNGNYLESHYWRGLAYEGLRRWGPALADLKWVAASSNNWFRVGAAIEMSVIFGKKHDYAAELASLDAYPYLFDPSLQSADDLAVAYNNRCFAYMKLGRLHKALSDCTVSLKYGRIPDALHKEMVLMRRLGLTGAKAVHAPARRSPPPRAAAADPRI